MTVEILWLTGLAADDALAAANTLLDDLGGHPDLRRLLVLDDTPMLVPHMPTYQRLLTARRVQYLLCAALGTGAGDGGRWELPGHLGSTQGSGVLWVGDPLGVDWRATAASVALGRPGGPTSGLDLLIELLSVDEVFDRAHAVMTTSVPNGVASPGLRLAGTEDEAATFAGALAVAIRRLTEPGPGPGADGPFPELLPAVLGGVTLAEGGELARCQADIADSVQAGTAALARLSGPGGRFRRSAGVHEHVVEAGAALADLRYQVDQLLRAANAAVEPTDNQRGRVQAAGVQLPAVAEEGTIPGVGPRSPVYQTIADALRGGDTLALVTRRLTLTERELKRHGSASYLAEVEQRCPAALLERLADPPRRPSRQAGDGKAARDLGLGEAARAADALADLVVAVANREWSGNTAGDAGVVRARIALSGVAQTLTEHADAVGGAAGAARSARLARLGEALIPVLCELVLSVLAAEAASPSAGGQEAFERARARTAELLAEWSRHAHAKGVLAQPAFAATQPHDVPSAREDDVAEIKESVLYAPDEVMWQLCAVDDLILLDTALTPSAVRFAPRLNRDMLGGRLPPDTVWTSSGTYAGLIRLVPLRAGVAVTTWGSDAS